MAWQSILDRDKLSVKLDTSDNSAILELNDGGMTPTYVTARLQMDEIGELIEALQRIRQQLQP